jgi:hypothetical protein
MRRAFPAQRLSIARWSQGWFATDEWKVNRRLTLTLGVRWDLLAPWKEAQDRLAVFDIDSGVVVVPDAAMNRLSPLMPRGYADVVAATSVGRPARSLIHPDRDNFQPRLGLAWRPFGESTVLRGGYGIYFDRAPLLPFPIINNYPAISAPFAINELPFTNRKTDPFVWPTLYPPGGGEGPPETALPDGVRPDLRIPYSMQYSFTVEHQRWNTSFRLTYNGANTRHGVYRHDANQPVADEQLYIDKPRRFPQFPEIPYVDNGAGHQYHALTIEAERRMSGGFHFQAYWTWARDIGDLEHNEQAENAYDRGRERAAWERLPTHRFAGSFIWQLPFGEGRRWSSRLWWVNTIVGGWGLSGRWALESGRFLTPLWRGPDPTGTRYANGPARPLVTLRPDHLFASDLDNPTVERWFDVDAFAPPPVGRFGNSAKGVIRGTPTEVLHAGVFKRFVLKESVSLRFEAVAMNVLNHPNYRDPNTMISRKGLAGKVTGVINRGLKLDGGIPRQLEMTLRLEW